MAAITSDFGVGGQNLNPKTSTTARPSLAQSLRDVADDLANLRTAFVALTAKIDADAGDTGGDSDYAATVDPPALLTTKA